MIDAIIYVAQFSELVAYLDTNAPESLARDEDGNLAQPPNVIAFARTPAVVNGDALLAYCRFQDAQAEEWRGTPGVEILSEVPYQGKTTGDIVYEQLFSNQEALDKYNSVYTQTKTYIDEDGFEKTFTQPKFGVMA